MAGEIGSPVFSPGGQCSGRAPQNSDRRFSPKLATHTLSLPSTAMPQGSVRPPPVKLDKVEVPSPFGVISVREGELGRLSLEASSVVSDDTHGTGRTPEFDTQAFPRLSTAMPIGALMPPPLNGAPIIVPSGPNSTTV